VGSVAALGTKKKALTEAMRDPETYLGSMDNISPQYQNAEKNTAKAPPPAATMTTRLAREVQEAVDSDPIWYVIIVPAENCTTTTTTTTTSFLNIS